MERCPVAGLLLLLVLTTSRLEALGEGAECERGSSPGDTLWEPLPEVTVYWAYGQDICASEATCYDDDGAAADPTSTSPTATTTEDPSPEDVTSATNAGAMPSQIKPLTIHPDTVLKFQSGIPHVSLQPWIVSQQQFASCNINGSSLTMSVIDNGTTNLMTVDARFLNPGKHYFIAITDDPLYQCLFGLRLNVTVKENECEVDGNGTVCSGRGQCATNRYQESYTCACCRGYVGGACQWEDPCYSRTTRACPEGATCRASRANQHQYTCLCAHGYTGSNCDQLSTDCVHGVTCKHGGVCNEDNSTSTLCTCQDGYIGRYCEEVDESFDPCDSDPCVHGMCVEQRPGYQCYCIPGFGGALCDVEYNECESDPCSGGGRCVDEVDGYRCECSRAWTGERCGVRRDLCRVYNVTCPTRAATCRDMGEHVRCECAPWDNEGECELSLDECVEQSCHHDALCVDLPDGYKCQCAQGYSGPLCNEVISAAPDRVPYKNGHRYLHRHLHNAYVAVATLLGSLTLAAVVISVWYCRHHGTAHTIGTISQAVSLRHVAHRIRGVPRLWSRKGSWTQNILDNKWQNRGSQQYSSNSRVSGDRDCVENHPSAQALYGATIRDVPATGATGDKSKYNNAAGEECELRGAMRPRVI